MLNMSSCDDYDEDYEEDDDDDCDIDFYYNHGPDDEIQGEFSALSCDPEHFKFELLHCEDVERLLNTNVEQLSESLRIPPSLSKTLLQANNWAVKDVETRYLRDHTRVLIDARIRPATRPYPHHVHVSSHRDRAGASSSSHSTFHGDTHNHVSVLSSTCPVCYITHPHNELHNLSCNHRFCNDCWSMHFTTQIDLGKSTTLECMGTGCGLRAMEDFVLKILAKNPPYREKYHYFAFRDHVESHPELRFCPGADCKVIVRAAEPKARRVECKECNTVFCFRCGMGYHAPTSCETIKQWLTKCRDDSETANYISAHTKDCPKCHVCIEKNGGCNHMQCFKCKFEFCWMCLGDWKAHGVEYYECSRYKDNPNIANESAHVQAREALRKYLFYYERWDNHAKSLRLEEDTLRRIRTRIEDKVTSSEGTWIDWQYLLTAADMLKKCRYTLQYTYPYAFYMDRAGAKKELFEYQQAKLEAEVENLSWKIERAEITDRGDLENQMDICEKCRRTLLVDFFVS